MRNPAGRCPDCGADVTAHVTRERNREERIEKVVAVISTILVLLLFAFTAGIGLVEGALGYALAGIVVWVLAQKTFWSR